MFKLTHLTTFSLIFCALCISADVNQSLENNQFSTSDEYADQPVKKEDPKTDSTVCPDTLLFEILAEDTAYSYETKPDTLGVATENPDDSIICPQEIAPVDSALQPDPETFDDSQAPEDTVLTETVHKTLYPGISPEQDLLALQMVKEIHQFNWDEANRVARRMQRLEKREQLPALSYLLLVSMNVFRVQHNEYQDKKARSSLIKEIDKLAQRGLELSEISNTPDSLFSTNQLIQGGIRGFSATLKMEKSLIEAAREGIAAIRILEQLIENDPSIKDGYLGLGIFYCSLSKAPYLVRAALNLTGRNVSLKKGLDYLRTAAYNGHYTYGAASLYLIQFLDPYYGHMAEEKSRLFSTLQSSYPQNPYYVFLELDEYLCFHPDKLSQFSASAHYRDKLRGFETKHGGSLKYATLVKYQYRLINPFPPEDLEPDHDIDLREFSYYPIFLQALREKLVIVNFVEKAADHKRRSNFVRKLGEDAQKMLDQSGMGPGRKGFYSWHIRDALSF